MTLEYIIITFCLALAVVLLGHFLRVNASLALARARAQSFLDAARVILVAADFEGRITLLNATGCKILGVSEEEALGLNWFDTFVPEPEREGMRDRFRKFAQSMDQPKPEWSSVEYQILDRSGELHLVEWHRSVVRDQYGWAAGVLSSGQDITERRRVERQLQFESYLLDSVSDSIIIHDAEGNILYSNSSAAQMRGLSRDELMTRNFHSLIAPEYLDREPEVRIAPDSKKPVTYEVGYLRADGSTMLLEVRAAMVEYEGHRAIASVGRDITERRQSEQKIRHMAFHDPLTGLANRLLFDERLNHALLVAKRRSQPLGLIFIDLDNFKELNDEFGHLVGDRVLTMVAERIRAHVRGEDTVARFGGDEFAVILPVMREVDDAELVAQTIADELRLPFRVADRSVSLSAAFGVASAFGDSTTADELIGLADSAMYTAKRSGHGRIEKRHPQAHEVANESNACNEPYQKAAE